MKTYIFQSLRITLLTVILFGILYPLFIVGTAKLFAPNSGKGKAVVANSKVIGFEVIGQSFTADNYFQSRPSAVNYNAAATGGSNKGPSNPDYLKTVQERIDDFIAKNPTVSKKDIPVDLVTASGGGLDPHISVKAAEVQVPRIAKARGIEQSVIQKLIDDNTQKPLLGLFGTSTVHVLHLNLALDQLK